MDNKGFHIQGRVLINDYLHFAVAFIENLLIGQMVGFKIIFYLFKGFLWCITLFGFVAVGK